jgi:glucosamine-phosphate N-acetyltransferase
MLSGNDTVSDTQFQITTLEKEDYNRGYLNLLEQLSTVGDISYEQFVKTLNKMNSMIYVIRDMKLNKIVASGTIFIEHKFIHNCRCVGHIEDIVVHKDYRRNGFGKMLINILMEYAKKNNCYKVILDCSIDVKNFYINCGFKEKGIEMSRYFDN